MPPVDIDNIQGQKFGPIGRCIYCGSDGGERGLRTEHIVPFSLGGNTELLEASCADCEGITSYLDGYLAKRVYYDLRIHANVQTRRPQERPDRLPAAIELNGERRTVDLPIKDHPFSLVLPVLGLPGLLRGALPSAKFASHELKHYSYVPPGLDEALGVRPGTPYRVVGEGQLNLTTFARAVAKIAYCHAIVGMGDEPFRPLATPEIILGRYVNVAHFVGGEDTAVRPPSQPGRLHEFEVVRLKGGRFRLLAVILRLFAHSGAGKSGMPMYRVVVGAEGRPVSHPKRSAPKTPRLILL